MASSTVACPGIPAHFGMILNSKAKIMHKLIETALADETKSWEWLAFLTKINEMEEKLKPAAEPVRLSNDYVREVLKGPRLVDAKSSGDPGYPMDNIMYNY